jgi:putative peptide zinc metalloprotease protein
MPIPYVDASASLAFRDKYQRMLVGAAGIMVEVFLAALAMLVWVHVEPGTIRAMAFNLMLISGVSTVLFNGNPLIRFDAYYVLADLLEIPNLATRSSKYFAYLFKKHLLGLTAVESPATSSGEARWFIGYGLASFCYRCFLIIRILLFIAGKFFFIGVLLAFWAAFSMIFNPMLAIAQFLFKDGAMQHKRLRMTAVVFLPLLLLIFSLVVVPFPLFTVAEGVVWAPDEAKIHAAANGFIDEVLVGNGARVEVGTPLLRCRDPELQIQAKLLMAQRREYQARYQQSRLNDLTEAAILQEEIGRIEAELQRAMERMEDLLIRSNLAGIFILPDAADLPGRFVRRGTPIGFVLDQQHLLVRVLVPQEDIERVRAQTHAVTVRLAERRGQELNAFIERQIPAATHYLPSLALSLEGGGLFALDPTHGEEARVFERLFQLDVRLEQPVADKINQRVYVRFSHPAEPLIFRWFRGLRRLVMSRFEV